MMTGHQQGHAVSTQRYQMLDVWRGVVSLIVVVEHVGVVLWLGEYDAEGWGGWLQREIVRVLKWNLGAPLFFVMSGYCIAASLLAQQRRGGTPLSFLARRLWRIYPTYWAALLGFVVLTAGFDALGFVRLHRNNLSLEIASPGDLVLAQWVGNLTLTETWRPLTGGLEPAVFTRVAWSLCYQEQFYVICVLALWLAPNRLGRALALATTAIVAFRLGAWDAGALHRIEGLFPVYWHEFAVGLAVYWRLNGCTGPATPANLAAKRGLDLFLVALLVSASRYGFVSTIAASGFGLLLIGLYRWDHLTGGLHWLGPVRACGRRSFSIYLAHLPVAAVGNTLLYDLGLTGFWARLLVTVPLVTMASVAVGWGFFHLVERWFLGAPALPRPVASARDPRLAPAVPA
jgi:peptidoglycan/LPS O-acetylase OafA/YrhL